MKMSREWAMPSPETFSIPPIAAWVRCHLQGAVVIVDPFARNSKLGTITNDLNPNSSAQFHMDAVAFGQFLRERGDMADAILFDPPYSPRQVTEVYQSYGAKATMGDTQTAKLYREVRNAMDSILKPGGLALSFGWNSAGFGARRGYEITDILLVAHGGAHNDTICVAERKNSARLLP